MYRYILLSVKVDCTSHLFGAREHFPGRRHVRHRELFYLNVVRASILSFGKIIMALSQEQIYLRFSCIYSLASVLFMVDDFFFPLLLLITLGLLVNNYLLDGKHSRLLVFDVYCLVYNRLRLQTRIYRNCLLFLWRHEQFFSFINNL